MLRLVFELKGEVVQGKEVPYYRWYLPPGWQTLKTPPKVIESEGFPFFRRLIV